MRHLTLLALVGLLLSPLAFWALNAEAHHVGNADYNEIGPCEDYFYLPDYPDSDYTDCWNVHGGVDEYTGLYPAPSDNMTGPMGPNMTGPTGPNNTPGTGTE